MLETDGGAVEPEQVDDVIVGVGETFVIKLPVTWENDLLLRTELLVECKGSGNRQSGLLRGLKIFVGLIQAKNQSFADPGQVQALISRFFPGPDGFGP